MPKSKVITIEESYQKQRVSVDEHWKQPMKSHKALFRCCQNIKMAAFILATMTVTVSGSVIHMEMS